jgi:hypothetical protein
VGRCVSFMKRVNENIRFCTERTKRQAVFSQIRMVRQGCVSSPYILNNIVMVV